MKVAIYNREQVEEIPWPKNADGEYARVFLTPMLKDGTKKYIENVDTELHVIVVGDKVAPMTLNSREFDNCYVVSPYSQYVHYALDELKELRSPLLELVLKALIQALSVIFKFCDKAGN